MTPPAPDVTVIIPAYNSVTYLPELLDASCARHPGFLVIHQDNNARPGRPRRGAQIDLIRRQPPQLMIECRA